MYEEKGKLEEKLIIVNVEKKKSEDELKKFEEDIDQVVHIMKEKEQFISNLKYRMLGLKNKYKAQLESDEQEINKLKWEIGELENRYGEFKEHVVSTVESIDREHEDEIKELEENLDALSDIIADKGLDIEGLTKELQDSKKEIENLRNQVEMLSAETVTDKQKGCNDQYYDLTGDISSEPDNALRKKGKLSRSSSLDNESYVLLEEKTTLLRSSSVDSGLNSDEENCDDDLSSKISPISSIEKVAERVKKQVACLPPL
jgi:chromosome segregation ATPase